MLHPWKGALPAVAQQVEMEKPVSKYDSRSCDSASLKTSFGHPKLDVVDGASISFLVASLHPFADRNNSYLVDIL